MLTVDRPAVVFRYGGLGHLVQLAYPAPWLPPPALVPCEDPHLLFRVLAALKRL